MAIHGRKIKPTSVKEVQALLHQLVSRKIQLSVSSDFLNLNQAILSDFSLQVYVPNQAYKKFDAFISIGGDGTFLETLTHVGSLETPILGINTGRLGFLASISQDQIRGAIDKLLTGVYEIEKRVLVFLTSNHEIFDGVNYALNEFSILRKDSSAMIVIKSYLNGDFLNSYWADGLMVSTPTGSTGYSLSCGGPILLPENENFIITPVSPHNLNIRPLIVPDTSVFNFEVESRTNNFLISLDSRSQTVNDSIQMKVQKAPFQTYLIKLEGVSFIETLRNKLSWGLDKRN
ncbi:MAG: NAD kinase [Flammeovirgaceae bacterium]|nr:NAD kinase [Flammeovirgaceae bacterium]